MELGSSTHVASPSADKNTGVVLLPCHTWKSVTIANSGGVDISKFLGCYLLQQMSSQLGSKKSLQGLVLHELTFMSTFLVFNPLPYDQNDVNQIISIHATL